MKEKTKQLLMNLYSNKTSSIYRNVFNKDDGKFIINDLIEQSKLYETAENMSEKDMIFNAGKQEIVKYIIRHATDIKEKTLLAMGEYLEHRYGNK